MFGWWMVKGFVRIIAVDGVAPDHAGEAHEEEDEEGGW